MAERFISPAPNALTTSASFVRSLSFFTPSANEAISVMVMIASYSDVVVIKAPANFGVGQLWRRIVHWF
jgi:hypothetical protein